MNDPRWKICNGTRYSYHVDNATQLTQTEREMGGFIGFHSTVSKFVGCLDAQGLPVGSVVGPDYPWWTVAVRTGLKDGV